MNEPTSIGTLYKKYDKGYPEKLKFMCMQLFEGLCETKDEEGLKQSLALQREGKSSRRISKAGLLTLPCG